VSPNEERAIKNRKRDKRFISSRYQTAKNQVLSISLMDASIVEIFYMMNEFCKVFDQVMETRLFRENNNRR
jgi:hypothetical protein